MEHQLPENTRQHNRFFLEPPTFGGHEAQLSQKDRATLYVSKFMLCFTR